jgi:hypothetical protein
VRPQAGIVFFFAGADAWSLADVQAPVRLRLYRAIASEVFVLDGRDQRIAVTVIAVTVRE